MQFVRATAEVFADYFLGNQNCYGVHTPERNTTEGEKAKGKSFTKTEPVTLDLYLKHLHGEESLGVVPLNHDNEVNFGVIDIDQYPSNPKRYMTMLRRTKLPMVMFRSKSGGLHLYLFFSKPTKATDAVNILNKIRQMFGLPKDTEIFPKQTRLLNGATGNWINLPYFNHSKTTRYAYDVDCNPMPLDKAVETIGSSRVTTRELKTILDKVPLSQAPPCMQTIFIDGGSDLDQRNVFLFNCAIYLKARFGETYAENLHKLNSLLIAPLEYIELDRTMISSHNKRDYAYQCKNSVLKTYCDREQCKEREYGIDSGEVSNLSFERLVQIKSSKPYYIWTVNGVRMTFYSESELMRQDKFRELCLRQLHTVPKKMVDKAWTEVLNRALENLEVEDVEATDDITTDSLWIEKVGDFLSRTLALNPSQVDQGLLWFDAKKGKLHFKGAKLLEHLSDQTSLRDFPASKHRALMKQLDARQARLSIGNGKVTRTWTLPILDLQEKGYFVDVEVNGNVEEKFEPINFTDEDKF